ncbi:lysozyme g-like isoform X2 [Astyanax mexicanus]|uniref:Lysozyme g n=1 Tax=Astyanax mexicanus TaxID=7994 RepID=A0A8T2KQG4_ASTMX|nr:lysozyme g-like isoform X2 [Astyanax mexicanus]
MALNLNIDLDKIPTTGAGPGTSKQLWNSSLTGVEASCALAQEDVERMKSYKNSILSVGRDTGIDPAIIAAIISRETRAGHFLQANGWNSGHKAFGIMQVHRDNHPRGGKDSEEHMVQAVGLLKSFIQSMNSSWSPELRYKGGIAAYNCGPGDVSSQEVDKKTEGGDYSSDVVARAQWYKKINFF